MILNSSYGGQKYVNIEKSEFYEVTRCINNAKLFEWC
jgi:hypothetical protein